MEFVTFDDKRFSVVQNGEKFFAVLPGESMHRITAYDYWNDKPSKFVFYRYGVACYGKIRVTAGSRQASRWITIGDLSLILDFRRAINRGQRIESFSGIEYRYAAIANGGNDEFGYPTFRVRLDPV